MTYIREGYKNWGLTPLSLSSRVAPIGTLETACTTLRAGLIPRVSSAYNF